MLINKYPIASVKQLISVVFPLMIAAFSVHFMLLIDRIVVAHYSDTALASITLAGNLCALVEVGAIILAAISEVFVGQYNGSKQYDKIAAPVWQMIWFGVGFFVITVPLGLYTGPIFIPEDFLEHGNPYYKWCMMFAPLHAIIAALSAFYIGRGKVRFTTAVVIFGNVINIVLDLVLVLGYKDIVPALGPVGAAYGTVISISVQTIILFFSFLGANNRKRFQTHVCTFSKELFLKCVRVGLPNSLAIVLEILGWFAILLITSRFKKEYVSLHAMIQSVLIFFIFFIDALCKGTSVVASNMIGSKKFDLLTKLLYSAFKINFFYLLILAVPLFFYPEIIINLFFRDLGAHSQYFIDQAMQALQFVWIFLLLDGIFWTGCGILIAGGDTMFLTSINSAAIWIFSVLPIFILVKFFTVGPAILWLIISVYKFVGIIVFIFRYRSKRWMKLLL
ncbi:MAG: MATE family efflux transporter [Alphaproteobacteria bacterium]|nr:MATE family efflux transporter [Alphaproteobacteria bacterium]